MRIIGINITRTSTGIGLHDGACALLEDGNINIAIAEERINRLKYSGGIKCSLNYCLAARNLSISDIDFFVLSNCADVPLDVKSGLKFLQLEGFSVEENKVLICPSHHLSHAASSFFASPFKEALIIVADNEGNIINKKFNEYWLNPLERTSIYIGKGNKIELLQRFNDRENELSIGAAYNYFTKWLGFKTYHDAGKTMALAAYGKGIFKKIKLFEFDKKMSALKCYLNQNHLKKYAAVRKLFKEQLKVDIGSRRKKCFNPGYLQKEVAWVIQKETEKALIALTNYFVKKTGIQNLCLAGGVALNCVANAKLMKYTPVKRIFIQPAANDTGQAIGNALWAYHMILKQPRKYVMNHCFLGRNYTQKEIKKALDAFKKELIVKKSNNIESVAAKFIAERKIIGWFQDNSEFGPRALGHRSIIGDPRDRMTKKRLDKEIKKREPFRPYAPSILEEHFSRWFEVPHDNLEGVYYPLKFMIITALVKKEKRRFIPAVVHIDGSSRVQIVNKKENPKFYKLIHEFYSITGIPLVLNTSLNMAGEPIVESPLDAIKSFLKMNLDFLVMNNFLIERRR
jgi:carbamoyltransferase